MSNKRQAIGPAVSALQLMTRGEAALPGTAEAPSRPSPPQPTLRPIKPGLPVTPSRDLPEPVLAESHAAAKLKQTIDLDAEVTERCRNAAYFKPGLTLSEIYNRGILREIERIEAENGGPYPPRPAALRRGPRP